MDERYLSITVEYGKIGTDEDGSTFVYDDYCESFDAKDVAPYVDLLDEVLFDAKDFIESV